jgi:hypothetical protein
VVEQRTVNPFVAGSTPASGVLYALKKQFLGAFLFLDGREIYKAEPIFFDKIGL